jgi:hypothetical protein
LEGWTNGSEAPLPTLQAAGGPDGAGDAFLQLTSIGGFGPGSHLAAYNEQANWIDDIGALGAVAVSVDMMSPVTSSSLEMRLVLFGPVNPVSPTNLNRRWTSTVAAAVPNDGVWRKYSFSLAEADLTRVQGTDSYDAMMADVLRVMLRHDAGSPSATGTAIAAMIGIDNVQFLPAPGDANLDGHVNGLDYLIWAANFGDDPSDDPPGSPENGDFNDDGVVNGLDYLLWAGNFGMGPNDAVAVPEPGTCALLVMGVMILSSRRRREGNHSR